MRTYIYPKEGFAERSEIGLGCWIRTESPSREDLDYLISEVGLPEAFLQDIADTDERPRTEEEDGWQLTILRIPHEMRTGGEDATSYTTVPIGVMSHEGSDLIVTICYYQTRLMPDFVDYVRRKNIGAKTHADFILRLIYSSAVWFLKYLKQVYVEVNQAEKALERSISNEDLLQLMKLQKTLVYFNTSIRGNEAMIGKLRTIYRGEMDEDLAEDVIIEMRQAYNMVNIYSDILTGTMDAFASIISNNVNTIMKRMTSISIVLMIPTLIASFYGMNVDVGLGSWRPAFFVIISVSFLLSLIIFYVFKRSRWI